MIKKSRNIRTEFLEDAILIRNNNIIEQYGKDSFGKLIPITNSKKY